MKKLVCGMLCLGILFSVCGCGKKVVRIDGDDLTDAFEEYFDWEEGEDYRVLRDREVRGTNFEDAEDPYFYDVNLYIQGCEFNDDTPYAYVLYLEFEDEEDAGEYFSHYYDAYSNLDDDRRCYRDGSYGYLLLNDDRDCFHGYIYADDMVIEYTSLDPDGIKIMKRMFAELKLPAILFEAGHEC